MSANPQSPEPFGQTLPESKVWTESERCHALAIYAETNSVTECERQTGIPKTTVHGWVSSERGAQAIEQLRTALRQRVAWEHLKTIDKGLKLLHKRMDLGDEVVLPNGKIVYKAVSARDLMMIIAVSQDKHASVVGQMDTTRNVDAQLSSLAAKLMDKLAKGNPSDNQRVKPISPESNPSDSFLG